MYITYVNKDIAFHVNDYLEFNAFEYYVFDYDDNQLEYKIVMDHNDDIYALESYISEEE